MCLIVHPSEVAELDSKILIWGRFLPVEQHRAVRFPVQVALWRGLNGVGLALVIPAIQSLVADSAQESTRGWAFGWLQSVTSWGHGRGSRGGVSSRDQALGDGWVAGGIHCVAVVSIVLAAVIHAFASDPTPSPGATKEVWPAQCIKFNPVYFQAV